LSAEPATIERLGALFAETFHIEPPAPDADLLESGVLDSFQLVELLLALERRFGLRVHIDRVELEDLRTLGSIARMLAEPRAA
jgi:D-alanine--poly(phosphoribitol) ligase subunit 2